MRLLRELEEQYGEVAYIVLPTVAVEHKYFVGPFSQAFPKAQAPEFYNYLCRYLMEFP